MGVWAKLLFGREKFDRVGLILAGTTNPKFEEKVLGLFNVVVSSKDSVYHGHLVKKDGFYYPILTNVYGGPALMDSLAEMYDGGCRNVIFIGYAYAGFKRNLDVGSIVLPTEAYHFDGIYSQLDPSRAVSVPDMELKAKVKEILGNSQIGYIEGKNITVPAVTFQVPHDNERYKKINPLTVEMELASCFSRAKDIGVRSAGILVISDNRSSSIGDETKHQLRMDAKFKVLKCLVNHIGEFDLPNLKTKKKFDINEYLTGIIKYPEGIANVYKKKR